MSEVQGCLCPGCYTVWYWDSTAVAWEILSNIDSWQYTPNVTQSTPKRTSSTRGVARRFCGDLVSYDLEVITTLCPGDWLFCDILVDPRQLTQGITTWFFTGWHCDYTLDPAFDLNVPLIAGTQLDTDLTNNVIPTHQEPGGYVLGKVQPPGFGGNNTETDPSTATFNVTIFDGPFLPECSEGGGEGIVEDPPDQP